MNEEQDIDVAKGKIINMINGEVHLKSDIATRRFYLPDEVEVHIVVGENNQKLAILIQDAGVDLKKYATLDKWL